MGWRDWQENVEGLAGEKCRGTGREKCPTGRENVADCQDNVADWQGKVSDL
jgi:hypothetical protein